MQDHLKAAIAEVTLRRGTAPDATRLSQDLAAVATRHRGRNERLSRHAPNMVLVDVQGTRVLLAVVAAANRQSLPRVFLSVGPSPILMHPTPLSRRHHLIAEWMVGYLRRVLPIAAVQWHILRGVTDAEVIADLVAGEAPEPYLPRDLMRGHPCFGSGLRQATSDEAEIANSLQRTRKALYALPAADHPAPARPRTRPRRGPRRPDWRPGPQADPGTSNALRLATHLMNGALAVTALPLGGALIVHATMTGRVAPKLTSRIMAMTGALSVLGQIVPLPLGGLV